MKLILFFLSFFYFSSLSYSQQKDSDNANSSIKFKSVKIGEQIWMSENLNVSNFRNGDPIPQSKSLDEWLNAEKSKQPSWCYYENDTKNGKKYGKLYNYYAVNDGRGLAPKGWKIPTDKEWGVLTDFLGGRGIAGEKMKSIKGWDKYEVINYDNGSHTGKLNLGSGTNESGFSALPGGFLFCEDYYSESLTFTFENIRNGCGWWSSTEYDEITAYVRTISNQKNYVYISNHMKGNGLSVRCIKE
jgi:uncharacterized protein (TIGR02145 family)